MIGRGLRPAAGKDELLILDHGGNCDEKHLGMPDQIHHAVLYDHPLPPRIHEYDPLPPHRCPNRVCSFVRSRAEYLAKPRCPKCGFLRRIDIVDIDLVKIEQPTVKERKIQTYQELVCEQRNSRYRRGWVGDRFKRIFGVYPKDDKTADWDNLPLVDKVSNSTRKLLKQVRDDEERGKKQ
jgi:DNA repair protein RadD